MLKQQLAAQRGYVFDQPPSGGCVLKPEAVVKAFQALCQPPSGGCVLKRKYCKNCNHRISSRLQAAVC